MSLIPGTNIRVDDFTAPRNTLNQFVFFLTHIHTDHLKGLTNSWNLGRIYTSKTTAALLIDRFENLKTNVIGLETQEEHLIYLDSALQKESITVTLFDANHCPGACMFLFSGKIGTVLHTGDFRYSRE
jgi:DNA cross-link repair 1B protein